MHQDQFVSLPLRPSGDTFHAYYLNNPEGTGGTLTGAQHSFTRLDIPGRETVNIRPLPTTPVGPGPGYRTRVIPGLPSSQHNPSLQFPSTDPVPVSDPDVFPTNFPPGPRGSYTDIRPENKTHSHQGGDRPLGGEGRDPENRSYGGEGGGTVRHTNISALVLPNSLPRHQRSGGLQVLDTDHTAPHPSGWVHTALTQDHHTTTGNLTLHPQVHRRTGTTKLSPTDSNKGLTFDMSTYQGG